MRSSPRDALWRLGLWVAYRVLLFFWFVFRPKRRGVFIGVWCGGELLVIKNSYRSWYALPAGGIKRGERLADAAARELREEVGIVESSESMQLVAEIPTTFEFKRDTCCFFELRLDSRPEVRVDGREVIWADFMTSQEALRRRLAPPVRVYLERRQELAR